MVVDADGRLVRWNRACEELLGYRQAELEAPDALLDLVPAAERRKAEEAMRALMAGESPLEAEFHWRTSTGELRLIEWSMTALTGRDGRSPTSSAPASTSRPRAAGATSAWRRRPACGTWPTTTT